MGEWDIPAYQRRVQDDSASPDAILAPEERRVEGGLDLFGLIDRATLVQGSHGPELCAHDRDRCRVFLEHERKTKSTGGVQEPDGRDQDVKHQVH